MNDNSYKVVEVDINEILPNRFQPRIQFDEEEILELSDSIKEHGVIQPIVVRAIGDKYEIIAGERRYKASVLAGKDTVPVIIKNLNDKDSAEIALIENIQRKNLTPIEEALSYKKILDMGYLTQESLANKIGKSQSSVANKIRLLNLSDEVQEALLDNKISERHARSLLRLKSISDQNEMLDKIIKERLTVRKTDEEIDGLLKNSQKKPKTEQSEIEIKEEKGEINMNNEINQISNITKPEVMNTFDIFGGTSQQAQPIAQSIPTVPTTQPIIQNIPEVPTMPVMEPVMPAAPVTPVATPQIGGIQFDANGNVISVGNATVPKVPAMPAAPVTPVTTPQIGGIQFDANGNVISVGNATVPEVPAMPTVPVTPVATPQIGGIQFDANGNVISVGNATVPEVPAMPAMPAAPVTPVTTPQIGGIQFDANGNVVSVGNATVPEVPTMPAVPVTPVATPQIGGIQFDANGDVVSMGYTTVPEVPITAPIIESAPTNTDSTMLADTLQTTSLSEPTFDAMPAAMNSSVSVTDPIIITDYNKQYDPVLPNSNPIQQNKVDFKEIINAIRECSDKIEKYGYRIDVEEYDLSTSYQVVFKIEK